MEADRYDNNHKLYILGIICLVACLTLFFFSMYIIPFLVWQMNYDVPDFVITLNTLFNEGYEFSSSASKILTWLVFFIPAMITGYISYYISNRIDNRIYHLEPEVSEEEKKAHTLEIQNEIKESAGLAGKILLLMIIIVVIVLLLQFFIQST